MQTASSRIWGMMKVPCGRPGLKFAVFSAESYSVLSPAYSIVLWYTGYTLRNNPAEIFIRGDVVEVWRDVGKRQR